MYFFFFWNNTCIIYLFVLNFLNFVPVMYMLVPINCLWQWPTREFKLLWSLRTFFWWASWFLCRLFFLLVLFKLYLKLSDGVEFYSLIIDLKMSCLLKTGANNFPLIFPAVEYEEANWGNEGPKDKEMWNFTFRDQVRGKLKRASL